MISIRQSKKESEMNTQQFLTRFNLFNPRIRINNNKTIYRSKNNIKQAAVLIPLTEKNNQIEVILTVRAQHLRHHAGQICFPGGKVEKTDSSHQATAIREAQEEIGIQPQDINIIGQLPTQQTLTGFYITPFIGMFNNDISTLAIDKNEVAELFTVPLSHFLNINNHLSFKRQRANNLDTVTIIPYMHYNIWGATAAILKNLSTHIRG